MDTDTKGSLPEMFRPILWSYRFEDMDPQRHKGEIIVNTINYGNLTHWRWIIDFYGRQVIQSVLQGRLITEFNKESRNLAQLIFSVNHFRDVRGSTH